MHSFTFNTTRSVHQEVGGSSRLGSLLPTVSAQAINCHVLLVTDPGIVSLGLEQPALQSLTSSGFTVTVFDEVVADPPAELILRAVDLAKSTDVSVVVGLGGGSSMDVAKLIALLAVSDQPLDAIYGVNQATGHRLPLVLVPTTAGTGSEVTPISIVTTGTEEKKGVVSPLLLPDLALLDAQLTLGLPPHITAATGIDAMVHAIEAYTSRSANNNPLSRMLATEALTLLSSNIREAVSNGSNLEARSNMLFGSMLAGQAFANSPVAAVHALAYPIGSLFHVPHGLSNAMVLGQVMRFNAPQCSVQYAELAPFIFPDIDSRESSQSVCAVLIDRLASLTDELGLKTGLKNVGITENDVDRLAADAVKQTRLLVNNPRELTLADAQNIYQQAL